MTKYKVTLKVSYKEPAFIFDDRLEAMVFMETAWAHHVDGDESLTAVKMELVEEAE